MLRQFSTNPHFHQSCCGHQQLFVAGNLEMDGSMSQNMEYGQEVFADKLFNYHSIYFPIIWHKSTNYIPFLFYLSVYFINFAQNENEKEEFSNCFLLIIYLKCESVIVNCFDTNLPPPPPSAVNFCFRQILVRSCITFVFTLHQIKS